MQTTNRDRWLMIFYGTVVGLAIGSIAYRMWTETARYTQAATSIEDRLAFAEYGLRIQERDAKPIGGVELFAVYSGDQYVCMAAKSGGLWNVGRPTKYNFGATSEWKEPSPQWPIRLAVYYCHELRRNP